MKKWSLINFLLIFVLLSIAGCGSSDGPDPTNQSLTDSSNVTNQSTANSFVAFGPITIEREKGKPELKSFQFSVQSIDIPYTIKVYNGGLEEVEGCPGSNNHNNSSNDCGHKVSSAEIYLNGDLIIGPDEFNQQVELIKKPVQLELENELSVKLWSKPGSVLTIEIIGIGDEPLLELAYVDSFELIWSDYGSDGNFHASFYRPVIPSELSEFHALGHIGYQGLIEVPNGYMLVARELKPGVLASPLSFQLVWDSANLGSELPASFWKPIPPSGYHCLGLLVKTGIDYLVPPDSSEIMCVRDDAVIKNTLAELAADKYSADLIWSTGGSPATVPFAVTQTIPKKDYVPAASPNDKTNENAIYVGSFTGSSYTDVFQDMDLAGWIDKRHVLQKNIDPNDILTLVETTGPRIFMHPEELYYPDDPTVMLDEFGSALCWGLVANEATPSDFSVVYNCKETSSATLMNDYKSDVELSDDFTNPAFRYWININDELTPGDLSRAKALINVLPVDAVFTDIQFWIFYPFNGPARARVCPVIHPCSYHQLTENGRHYGDWEQLTLRFLNRNKELVAVYMSRHDKGEWFSRNFFNITLQLIDGHPIVFSGKYSHALYPGQFDEFDYHITLSNIPADVFLYDTTGYGAVFYTDQNYEIINSGITGVPTVDPPWLGFEGTWGQYLYSYEDIYVPAGPLIIPYPYEKLERGPFGPNLKYDFKYGNGNYWFWYPVID